MKVNNVFVALIVTEYINFHEITFTIFIFISIKNKDWIKVVTGTEYKRKVIGGIWYVYMHNTPSFV